MRFSRSQFQNAAPRHPTSPDQTPKNMRHPSKLTDVSPSHSPPAMPFRYHFETRIGTTATPPSSWDPGHFLGALFQCPFALSFPDEGLIAPIVRSVGTWTAGDRHGQPLASRVRAWCLVCPFFGLHAYKYVCSRVAHSLFLPADPLVWPNPKEWLHKAHQGETGWRSSETSLTPHDAGGIACLSGDSADLSQKWEAISNLHWNVLCKRRAMN